MSVADILRQMGENAANVRLQRGSLIGGTIADLSHVPGQIMADRERKLLILRQQAAEDAKAQYAKNADTRAASDQAMQEAAMKTDGQNKADWRQITGALYQSGGTLDYDAAAAKAHEIGRPDLVETLNKHKTDNVVKPLLLKEGETGFDPVTREPIPGMSVAPKPPTVGTPAYEVWSRQQELQQPQVMAPGDYGPARPGLPPAQATQQAYDDQRAAEAVAKAADSHSPIYREWKDYQATGGALPFDAYMTADANRKRPVVNVGGMAGMYNTTDPVAIAAQIRAGKMPPDIAQYGRPVQGAIASVLAKKGPNGEAAFDLSSALREWKAQLKLNATMNGGQQVRLDESIRSGLAMYDKVDTLAEQWDGMGLGPLSRANLAAARNGLKGKAAASIANQLTGQIGQLTSDIATIEQGGLTPTNESRKVAEQSMQDWWGKGTIKDMTAQGRYNMQIRHTARNTQEPMAPGNGVDSRPAAPATPRSASPTLAAGGVHRVVQNGVTYDVTTDAAGKVISSKAVRP